jgi:hypothetical protein
MGDAMMTMISVQGSDDDGAVAYWGEPVADLQPRRAVGNPARNRWITERRPPAPDGNFHVSRRPNGTCDFLGVHLLLARHERAASRPIRARAADLDPGAVDAQFHAMGGGVGEDVRQSMKPQARVTGNGQAAGRE